jgi:hypothetical protein
MAILVPAAALALGAGPALGTDGSSERAGESSAIFDGASSDGTIVFFETTESLVASDTDGSIDIYQRSGGTTTLVSAGEVNGNGAFDVSFDGASTDGTKVFFTTNEPLVTTDTDGSLDDVYERSGGTTKLVSTGPMNANGAYGNSFSAASHDGTRVFFGTTAPLVAADTDTTSDVYERSGGTTTLISTGPVNGGSDPDGNFYAYLRGLSSDGTKVFFATLEPLVAADVDSDIDVYQRSGGVTTLISRGVRDFDAAFRGASKDGSRVFFTTSESLVAADTDGFVDTYERSGGVTKLISTGPMNGNGHFDAYPSAVSNDGTTVVFETRERLVAADTDSSVDVYQRSGATTTLVSAGTVNGDGAFDALFSGASKDGTRIFFRTRERLVAGDTDAKWDLYERSAGTTKRVSAGPGTGNRAFNAAFVGASVDGTKVFFKSRERLVATDTDTVSDVYERSGGTTRLVSAGAVNGNGPSRASFAGASSDGTRVFFVTVEPLVAGDTDGVLDVYERSSGTTTLISRGP